MPAKAATYFHTLRYLRPVQFYGRLWSRLHRPRLRLEAAPAMRPFTGLWSKPPCRLPSMYAPAGFSFLNETHELILPWDWNHLHWEKLWLYNLHYFDDLNAYRAAERKVWHRALITHWIAENPPGIGNGWEPYPLSLRIVNWIKWALAGNPLDPAWVESLAVQVRWLRQRIEWHLLGNHLFANAKALVFAGVFFQGKEPEAWLGEGLKILAREVPEQILPDGGHFERSPMYHALILEDLLDLLNLAQAYPSVMSTEVLERWREAAGRMLVWLKALCHPDGEIGFFNDAALGVAPAPAEIFAYGDKCSVFSVQCSGTEQGAFHLTDSGYIRLAHGPAVALLDVAPIGPDYLPGHAHADTLSFELSVFSQRVLVNSGTSCYGTGPERLRQRATAAHNTVMVNAQNSSEVWGGFRVARRARPLGLNIEQDSHRIRVRCGHTGYQRLPGRPIHWRRWELSEKRLSIRDSLQGPFYPAIAYFHFHPAVKLELELNGKKGSASLSNGKAVAWEVCRGKTRLNASFYHPRFGVSEANQVLEVSLEGAESQVTFYW